MDAINKLMEAKRIQKALKTNPKDVDSLLKLAALLDKEPEDKRRLLTHILSLDPVNKAAREMLFEMDRAEMSGGHSQTASPSISTTQHPAPASARSSNAELEEPLVFSYSIVHQILVLLLIAITVSIALSAIRDTEVFIVMVAFLLLLIIPLWFVSLVVEISSSGIKVARLFGIARWEIPWSEIEKIKPNAMGQGIKIITNEGKVVEISSQIHGYPAIVETLLRLRPDLFNMAGVSKAADAAGGDPDASFTGTTIFQKSFLAKYVAFFLLIPACVISTGTLFAHFLAGILAGIVVFLFWIGMLSAVHTVKVEGNRLSAKSLLKRKEVTALQIKDISMISRRNRRGVAKTFISIELQEGASLRLSGFPEGNEIMYGFLSNWWSAHQNN